MESTRSTRRTFPRCSNELPKMVLCGSNRWGSTREQDAMDGRRLVRHIYAFATLSALGCGGNAVATGDYQGPPLFTLHARVSKTADEPPPSAPTMGLMWINDDARVAGDSGPIRAAAWPHDGFELSVFNAPPDTMFTSFVDAMNNVV